MIYDDNLYIVIVTFNAMSFVEKCLGGILNCNVIVVDNNSTDGTGAYIQNNFPQIVLLQQDDNLGFGKGNNLGIQLALENGAKSILLLNQDAYLSDEDVRKLVGIHSKNRRFGILSPIHLNGTRDKLDEAFSSYLDLDFYSDLVLQKEKKIIYTVPFVNAASWLISSECFKVVGGFDPIFSHYGEDDNFCQRVRYHGFTVGVVPQIYMRHDRQERPVHFVSRGSDAYFQKMERILKVRYGNINNEELDELKKLLLNRKKRILKSFLSMNMKEVKYNTTYYKMLERVLAEVIVSRKINKKRGMHYL